MEKEAIEAAVTTVASKSTYGGAATSFFGWLASSEFTVIVGLAVAVGGFLVNWYYKTKADRREAEAQAQADARAQVEHELRVAQLRRAAGRGAVE